MPAAAAGTDQATVAGGPDKQIVSLDGNVVQSSLDLEVDALGGEDGRGCQRWVGIRLTEQAGHIPGKQLHIQTGDIKLPLISLESLSSRSKYFILFLVSLDLQRFHSAATSPSASDSPSNRSICCHNQGKNPLLLFLFAGSLQTEVVALPFRTHIHQL